MRPERRVAAAEAAWRVLRAARWEVAAVCWAAVDQRAATAARWEDQVARLEAEAAQTAEVEALLAAWAEVLQVVELQAVETQVGWAAAAEVAKLVAMVVPRAVAQSHSRCRRNPRWRASNDA